MDSRSPDRSPAQRRNRGVTVSVANEHIRRADGRLGWPRGRPTPWPRCDRHDWRLGKDGGIGNYRIAHRDYKTSSDELFCLRGIIDCGFGSRSASAGTLRDRSHWKTKVEAWAKRPLAHFF